MKDILVPAASKNRLNMELLVRYKENISKMKPVKITLVLTNNPSVLLVPTE